MPTLTFYPLGNADTCRVALTNGDQLLFDYAAMKDVDDKADKRCDLPDQLRKDLKKAKKTDFDVVAFTHLDDDHVCGAPDFFFLEHAKSYQDGDRPKITELWVPAAALIEEGLKGDALTIRGEARHRFKEGTGIRVFSRPEKLREWIENEGLPFEDRKHLITDAGQTIPGFTTENDGVEFFVHSPFASRLDNGELIDRNTDALVLHLTFSVDGAETKVLLGSDVDHEALSIIIDKTRAKDRPERLEWDIFKLPHHCSYLSIGPEKGKAKTAPVDQTKWLFEEQASKNCKVVSSSWPIPAVGSEEDENSDPPHGQAANYYRDALKQNNGEFKVTMEHPKPSAPEPLVIEIDATKARLVKSFSGGAASVLSQSAPRAGIHAR